MTIPQFTLVPYDIDIITLGMRGPLVFFLQFGPYRLVDVLLLN